MTQTAGQKVFTSASQRYGALPGRTITVSSTGVAIATGERRVSMISLSNSDAAAVWVKLYDKATAPTSADTPIQNYLVPAGGAYAIPFPDGLQFSLGIGIRAVTGFADNDTTSPTASKVAVSLAYK